MFVRLTNPEILPTLFSSKICTLFFIHIHKNLFDKNVEAEIHPDVKNMLRTHTT